MNVFQKIAQKLFKKAVKKSVEAVPDGAGRDIVHGTLIFPGLPVADRGIGGPSFFLFLTFKQ